MRSLFATGDVKTLRGNVCDAFTLCQRNVVRAFVADIIRRADMKGYQPF